MVISLNDTIKSLSGEKINAGKIKDMVVAYRRNANANALKFAHFEVEEVLQLLIDNKIIESYVANPAPIVGEGFGLKIYIGNHFDSTTCPTDHTNYEGYNTTILCNTVMMDSRKGEFYDLLDKNHSVALPIDNKSTIMLADGGYGLDQTYICPTTCPTACVLIPSDPSDPAYTGVCVNDIGM